MYLSGDRVQEQSVYTTRCCSYDTVLNQDQEFPACGICGHPTQWLGVASGDARPADRRRAA
jgi:hypothetical protein